jgi:phosphatidylglycerol:prolipoprotein diacylglycerol transferase
VIDNVAINIFGIAIHWYGILYATGILIANYNMEKFNRLNHSLSLNKKQLTCFLNYILIAMIIFARILNCLVYEYEYFAQHPYAILYLWDGGLSFYGGFVGVVISLLLQTKYLNLPFLLLCDYLSYSVGPAIFLVRIGNFINGELIGRPSNCCLAYDIGDNIMRHPSQLYEAFGEGIVVCLVIYYVKKHVIKNNLLQNIGVITGSFLLTYGITRFICEFFREIELEIFNLPVGQFSSAIMAILGMSILMYRCSKQKYNNSSKKIT